MKKVFSLLAVLALVCMATSAWATDTVITALTKTSVADFSQQGAVTLELSLFKVSDDSAVSTIDWDVANIPLNQATENWTTSTVYATLNATVTKNNGAIYMYQNNKAAGTYHAEYPRHEGNPSKEKYSGLVNKATQGGDDRGFIPLVYQITATKAAPSFGTTPTSVTGTRYFTDQGDDEFDIVYSTIANNGGLVDGYLSDGTTLRNIGSNTGYMYFGGKFSNVRGGDIYGTSTIQFVSHVE